MSSRAVLTQRCQAEPDEASSRFFVLPVSSGSLFLQFDALFQNIHKVRILGNGFRLNGHNNPLRLFDFLIDQIDVNELLRELQAPWGRVQAWLAGKEARFLYLVCRETVDPGARLHARMIFYGGEDPATGSAAGCAAAWMAATGVAASDERVLIEQGLEARRPSRIFVRARRSGDRVTDVRVGGQVVEVMRGEVLL